MKYDDSFKFFIYNLQIKYYYIMFKVYSKWAMLHVEIKKRLKFGDNWNMI